MERYVESAVKDMLAAREELLAAFGDVGERDWGRYVPYGSRTLHDLLAHAAAADHAWALAARDLLKGDGQHVSPLTPEAARSARERAIEQRRAQAPRELIEGMRQRRGLLLSLYELLEPRHLSVALRSFGDEHNSVRERIWLGYHDRMHAADVRRALRSNWHPQRLGYLPEIEPAARGLSPDAVLYVAFSVDPVWWEKPSPVPGWTSRQLLSHIATGDWVFQGMLEGVIERGNVPPWPDIDAGNAQRLAGRRFSTDRAFVEEYLSMRHETLRLLSCVRPEHLGFKMELWWMPTPNEHTLLEYIANFWRHEHAHTEQLRPAMKYTRAA